jgi:predicted ATPase
MISINFQVVPRPSSVRSSGKLKGYLVSDQWDDWGKFSTMFSLVVFDEKGERHDLGSIKIGEFGLKPASALDRKKDGERWAAIPDHFQQLGEQFFSLGQSETYYEKLRDFGKDLRDAITIGLRDVVADQDLWQHASTETVTTVSLLREVTSTTVERQFRRLLAGGARLTPYVFTYTLPKRTSVGGPPLKLTFEVQPDSRPPSNIHVIIGPNGAGKSYLLNLMAKALVGEPRVAGQSGSFDFLETTEREPPFANVVSVSFSAFDNFDILDDGKSKFSQINYAYIGLKEWESAPKSANKPKSPDSLAGEFARSVPECVSGVRMIRWQRALKNLETDPLFKDRELALTFSEAGDEKVVAKIARDFFDQLSSGHKLVLLTVARLVEEVEEKTLVLLDEPEGHLHPPLLSAFVRTLSELLVNRNGVAIVATHSPVVLQEVPMSCVYKMNRAGGQLKAERPETETFGENVGILTREVFTLEVARAGFHQLLLEAADKHLSYEAAVESFDSHLGGEARAILRSMFLNKPPS